MPKASRSMPDLAKRTNTDMSFRSLEVRGSSLNVEDRTIGATISTELPVPMPDWQRMEMVPEVLLARGMEYPKSRQVPFLNSHSRSSMSDQIGSARNVTVEDGQSSATLHFSSVAQDEFTKVREGHATDVSVGYDVLKRIYVDAGKTKRIGGREFTGPVNVVTKWRLREVSLTPIGADEQAKLRGLDPAAVLFQSPDEKGFKVNEQLRAKLVEQGMPAHYDDERAQQWLVDNFDAPSGNPQPSSEEGQRSITNGDDSDRIAKAAAEAARKAIEAENKRQLEWSNTVRSLCELADMPEEFEACRGLSDEAAIRKHIQDKKAARSQEYRHAPNIRVTGEGFDRFKTDVRGALCLSALRATGAKQEAIDRVLPEAERGKNLDKWRHARLFDFAQEYVRQQGIDTLGLTREQVAIAAMFGSETAGIRSAGGYHTTGDFASLTLDAINKSMMVGYTEVPSTWRGPMRQGASVADFKTINRIRLGAIPNLPVWNDTDDPELASMKAAKEAYAVEARSIGVDFSYSLIVNDDMDALTRTPMQLGDASARTVNAVAWSQITSSPTMSDSVALFSAATGNRKQSNLTTGAISDYTAAINTMTQKMMTMRGENTPEEGAAPDILGLMPQYIVLPSALRGTLLQLIGSENDPHATITGVRNINTGLVPIIEPLLDANSATAFYLFANPTRIDTVEVTFLQGQETPVVRSQMNFDKLSMRYYVLQSVGAKALNHRGMQRHDGA